MKNQLYIYKARASSINAPLDCSALKKSIVERIGAQVRRVHAFGLYAMASLLETLEGEAVAPATALYLSTPEGPAESTMDTLYAVFRERCLPLPVDFIHTMNNTASFYCAKMLKLTSENITITQPCPQSACFALARLALCRKETPAVLCGSVSLGAGASHGTNGPITASAVWLYMGRDAGRSYLCSVSEIDSRACPERARQNSAGDYMVRMVKFMGESAPTIVCPSPSPGGKRLIIRKFAAPNQCVDH
jgi:hypothetical protein